jgi:hypothetical protein
MRLFGEMRSAGQPDGAYEQRQSARSVRTNLSKVGVARPDRPTSTCDRLLATRRNHTYGMRVGPLRTDYAGAGSVSKSSPAALALARHASSLSFTALNWRRRVSPSMWSYVIANSLVFGLECIPNTSTEGHGR